MRPRWSALTEGQVGERQVPEVEVQTTPATEAPLSETSSSKLLTIAGAWQRIKEHKVIQWGIAYFAAALALAHAYEIAAHTYHWPPFVGQILVGMFAIGFLVALVLAWYHGHRGLTHFSAAEMSILAVLLLVGAGMPYLFVEADAAAPRPEHAFIG